MSDESLKTSAASIYEINLWPYTKAVNFTLINSLFEAVKLTKDVYPSKYKYFGYGTGLNILGSFSLSNSSFGKNVVIFGVDMTSFVHIDNKKKDILILAKDPTKGLDDATLSAEKKYSLSFTKQQNKLCLSLH